MGEQRIARRHCIVCSPSPIYRKSERPERDRREIAEMAPQSFGQKIVIVNAVTNSDCDAAKAPKPARRN
jgi:hypothetical protein